MYCVQILPIALIHLLTWFQEISSLLDFSSKTFKSNLLGLISTINTIVVFNKYSFIQMFIYSPNTSKQFPVSHWATTVNTMTGKENIDPTHVF